VSHQNKNYECSPPTFTRPDDDPLRLEHAAKLHKNK